MQPFRQASNARGGTGLGLSISKGLVTLMGGTLEVQSTLGAGTEFFFTLRMQDAAVPKGSRSAKADVESQPEHAARILIVDDDGTLRTWLRRLLQAEGFVTEEAENGRDAIGRFGVFRPDLILMDLRMPVMGGLEAIQNIRMREGGARVPILLLSAEIGIGERGPLLAGATYQRALMKPIEADALIGAVRAFLPAPDPKRPLN
jgi:CheY-like chemotaxis protein